MMTKLTLPTIHLNGSDPQALIDELEPAIAAVTLARQVLAAARPNARDYYPQGDGVYEAARREHNVRDEKLQAVQDELTIIHAHIVTALEARRVRRTS